MASKITTDRFEYLINKQDCIVDVSESWLAFATDNAPTLTVSSVLGKSLWDFVSNVQTRYLYKLMLKRVREHTEVIQVPFRCDSPDCRRFMELEISPQHNDYVRFLSKIIRTEPRPPVSILDSEVPRSDKKLCMCSWCKQIQVDARHWLEVEYAVAELRIFDDEAVPGLIHGICPDCEQRLFFRIQSYPLQGFAD